MATETKRSKYLERKAVKHKKHYEDKLCEDLADSLEILTHSGNKTLNQAELTKVINICNHSNKYVTEAYNMVLEHLKENHAEVRLSATQVIDELFRRFHCFRELLVPNIEQMVELTLGKSLPPPTSFAKKLKDLAVRSIHEWYTSFGETYSRLTGCYKYLRVTKKDAFSILDVSDSSSRRIDEEDSRHQERINQIKFKRLLAEINEKELDIKATVTSLSNCINLLLPHPDDFFIASEEEAGSASIQEHPTEESSSCVSESDEEPDNSGLREVGIHSVNHVVELTFTPSAEVYIKETADNSDIIQTAHESAKMIRNKQLSIVNRWLEDLAKCSENTEAKRRLMELKGDLDDVMFKYNSMIFVTEDDVSSDSDLEEVEEPETFDSPQPKEPDEPVKAEPSTSGEGVSRKQKLLAIAPKRPFDVDLYHWEDEKLPVPTLITNSTEGHRFWVGADSSLEEVPVPEGSAALRTRVIEFAGSFTPVSHSCKVRLPSGKLCPRRDRYKCPFHGEIVPRDDRGYCINPQDAVRMQKLMEKRQQEKPDWQDPKLLAEIKKTTGIDLKMPEKGKRKRKERKHPGLTDLKQIENTAKNRLKKKLFQKTSMKRVAAVMDRMDQRKFSDKFGDQFNYFFNS